MSEVIMPQPAPPALPGPAAAPVLYDQFGRYIESRIPVQRRTIFRTVQPDQPVAASMLDVDQVHAILTGADNGDVRQLFALYDQIVLADSHIQGELGKRKLAVLGDQWVIQPENKDDPQDALAAQAVETQLKRLPSFFDACASLLDGAIYPLALIEKVYRPARVPGLRYEIDDLIQVPARLLDYAQERTLRILDTDAATGEVLSTHHMPDPMRYIIHRGHLLGQADHRGGPMRSLVFWWLFGSFDRDWWARFLDRYGSPFIVGKYDQSDDASRVVLQNAFSLAARLGGIVISRDTEVELQQAMASSTGDAYNAFHTICQKEKSKLIIGQTSVEVQATGLGSGVSKEQGNVRDDIRQFDALRLGNTLVHQLFAPWLRFNGLAGAVKITWGAEDPEDTEKTSRSLSSLFQAGVEVSDEGIPILSQRMGLPLRRAAAPAAAGAVPGQPMPGQPGAPAAVPTQKLIDSLGVGGTQALMALLSQVASGAITRPAAIETLQVVFGLTAEDAARLLPSATPGPPAAPANPVITALGAKFPELAALGANDKIASTGAADLSQAFRRALAPVRQILRESKTPAEFESRLRLFFADWSPGRITAVLEQALVAYTANAVTS